MAGAIYGRPSDDVAANASVTVETGTEDTDYPVSNLTTTNPAKPGKLTTSSGRIVFDFGSAQTIQLVALIHTNLDAGLTVKIQANATNSWATPSLDTAITIPTVPQDSYPLNPWLDLSGSVQSYRYWAVYVSGTNSAAVAIGKVCLQATKRELSPNLLWGYIEAEERPAVEHRTTYGVSTVYTLGPRLRRVIGRVKATTAGATDLLALERAAGHRGSPFLFILHPDQNDALYVRWATPMFAQQYEFTSIRPIDVAFEEVSRGLRL